MLLLLSKLNPAPIFLKKSSALSCCNLLVHKIYSSPKSYQSDKQLPPLKDEFTDRPLYDATKGKLIYGGPLTKTIKAVKLFSITSSGLGLVFQPFLFYKTPDTSVALKAGVSVFFAFFILVTPLLIHMVSRKYVTDLYFDEHSKIFTAATFNLLSFRKELTFKAEDVEVPAITGPFTSVIVKGKPLFMDPKFFLCKDSYIHLMGYDKPLDWEMPKPDEGGPGKGGGQ
ncbi:transmembrane protein 70 homolog, mitochondrial-like [Argonauta hians]